MFHCICQVVTYYIFQIILHTSFYVDCFQFSQRGTNSDILFIYLFFFDEGREDPNSTNRGPSSVNGPTLNAGLVAL